tara:strand:- start:542 stop:763 length:222 start_codon:yes stop_codon:yes gene_type:complete
MGYKLICNEKYYETQYFSNRREARQWLFNHARLQLNTQADLREPNEIGHDIDLRSVDTYALANYFDFTLIKQL